MQTHKYTSTETKFSNFLEQKIIFNDIQRYNYPKECRNADFHQAQRDYQRQAQYQVNDTITQAQQSVLRCQNALARVSWDKLIEDQGLVIGQELTILGGAIEKGLLVILKPILKYSQGGYTITGIMNGVKKTFTTTKDGASIIHNAILKSNKIRNPRNPTQTHLPSQPEQFTNHAGRTIDLTATGKSRHIGRGGVGNVDEISYIVSRGGRTKTVPMARKTQHSTLDPKLALIKADPLKIHKALQEANIPTFNTLRVNNRGTIITTPLNTNGTFAISANNKFPAGFNPKKYNFSEKTTDDLITEVSATINKAINHNIKLTTDSIFFLPNKNGSINHMIGDFDIIQISNINRINDPMLKHLERLDIINANMKLYDSTLTMLTKIKPSNSRDIQKIIKARERHYNSWIDSINR